MSLLPLTVTNTCLSGSCPQCEPVRGEMWWLDRPVHSCGCQHLPHGPPLHTGHPPHPHTPHTPRHPSYSECPGAVPARVGWWGTTGQCSVDYQWNRVLSKQRLSSYLSQLELTPNSLPSLLGGDLATPLVMWCDSQVTSDKREAFRQVALRSKGQSEWSFAWIDRYVLR